MGSGSGPGGVSEPWSPGAAERKDSFLRGEGPIEPLHFPHSAPMPLSGGLPDREIFGGSCQGRVRPRRVDFKRRYTGKLGFWKTILVWAVLETASAVFPSRLQAFAGKGRSFGESSTRAPGL